MFKKRLLPIILLPTLMLALAGIAGCGNTFDQSFKLMSRTLPSLGIVLEGVLCVDTMSELPAIMRFNFDGRLGWIIFEERYQGRVWASYRLEPQKYTVSVPGEGGRMEDPGLSLDAFQTQCGVIELRREGKLLRGVFQEDSDTKEKGELMLQFSHNMQSFTGKWRLEGDGSWKENLTGSAN